MESTARKRNVYAILFFMAFLFLLVGLEKNSPVSGFFTRSSSAYPETWFLSCMSQNSGPQQAGQQLAEEIVETFGPRQAQQYCADALKGFPLQHITVTIQCPSPLLREEMLSSCEQYADLLRQKSSPSRFGFRR